MALQKKLKHTTSRETLRQNISLTQTIKTVANSKSKRNASTKKIKSTSQKQNTNHQSLKQHSRTHKQDIMHCRRQGKLFGSLFDFVLDSIGPKLILFFNYLLNFSILIYEYFMMYRYSD
jgi:seryl-tRNA synthetase